MIKNLLLLLLTLASLTTSAQIKFAPELGINMAMMNRHSTSSMGSKSEVSKLSPGVKIGAIADIGLAKYFFLQTGIFYTWNNVKFSEVIDFSMYGLENAERVSRYRTHNIQVPLFALYKSGFEGAGRFFIGAGPYLGYALSGRENHKVPVDTYDAAENKVSYYIKSSESAIEFGDDPATDRLRNLDYGAIATMGYQSNVGLYFRSTFHYGLANVQPGGSSDNSLNNWGMGLSIGVMLGKDGW